MNIILTASTKFTDTAFMKETITNKIAEIQVKNSLGLSEIEIVIPLNKGGDTFILNVCKELGLNVKTFEIKWKDLETQPVYLKQGKFGMINAWAGQVRNIALAEYVRKAGGGVLIAFQTTKTELTDLYKKVRVAGNITEDIIDCKKLV